MSEWELRRDHEAMEKLRGMDVDGWYFHGPANDPYSCGLSPTWHGGVVEPRDPADAILGTPAESENGEDDEGKQLFGYSSAHDYETG